jgi:hypothetical protein
LLNYRNKLWTLRQFSSGFFLGFALSPEKERELLLFEGSTLTSSFPRSGRA